MQRLLFKMLECIQVNLPEDNKIGTGIFFIIERFIDWVYFLQSTNFDEDYTIDEGTKDFFDSL